MRRSDIIKAVDGEIHRLELLREQLIASQAAASRAPKLRVLTEEGRKRISEAQHRRWAGARAPHGNESVKATHSFGVPLR